MQHKASEKPTIAEGVEALKAGLLVAFPTETVYGLGADASNPAALKRLYQAKGRPTNHPVIVHLSDIDQVKNWAREVPEAAMVLARAFWPGPLTLILPRAESVSDAITGGQDSVGLRIPSHPLALSLLMEFGGGVAAPSANKFGRLSATSAEDVAKEFLDEVAVVLDGGHCEVGIESTIVDFSSAAPRILRPGMIVPEQIVSLIGEVGHGTAFGAGADKTVRAPGGLPSHYAPKTPLRLVGSVALSREVESLTKQGLKVCVLSFVPNTSSDEITWLAIPNEPQAYARQLYRSLRKLDQEKADIILVETVPTSDSWSGIADRLARASAPKY